MSEPSPIVRKQNEASSTEQSRVALMKLERLYYKHDKIYEVAKTSPNKTELYFLDGPSADIILSLVNQVMESGTSKLKMKAILLQSYHHALHNRYELAEELIMRSRISHKITT